MVGSDQEAESLVSPLRDVFFEKYADSINNGFYDDRDLEWLRTDDTLVKNFLFHQHCNVDKAAAMIDMSFKFRLEYSVNDLEESCFPREMHENGGMFYHSRDKKGNKILQLRICKHKKDASKLLLHKKFVIWWLEKQYKKWPEEQIVVLMDMTDAGLANMDLDLIKFQISCFTSYYPHLLAYMLIYEMPWLMNAIWKIIKQLLSQEEQEAVKFVKKSEIKQHIDTEQLLIHLGGNDDFVYQYLPSEDSGIDIPTGDELPDDGSTSSRKRVTFAEQNSFQYASFEDNSSPDYQLPSSTQNRTGLPNGDVRRSNKTENVLPGKYLMISPAEELQFQSTGSTVQEIIEILTLKSIGEKAVAFKVKTTAPEKFRVKTSSGLIQQGGATEVHIFLQPGHHNTVSREKFLVMALEVEGTIKSSELSELWRSKPRDLILEHRLKCSYIPSQPKGELAHLQQNIQYLSQKVDRLVYQNNGIQNQISRLYKLNLFCIFLGCCAFLVWIINTRWTSDHVIESRTNSCMPLIFQ